MNELVPSPSPAVLPALFAPTPKAVKRFVEFFTAQLNNDHTRKAYLQMPPAASHNGAKSTTSGSSQPMFEPFHVAAFIKELPTSHFRPATNRFRRPL